MSMESDEQIKILLVEDNLVNCEVAVDMLDELGFEADVATNGQVAIDMFDSALYALVLMDCEMPVMDGFTATKRLRENEERLNNTPTPIIALTAHAVTGAKDKCFACGMDDFLSKPFTMSTLQLMLDKWLLNAASDVTENEMSVTHEISQDITNAAAADGNVVATSAFDENILDRNIIERLCSRQKNNGSSLANKIIAVYLEQSSKLLNELTEATKNNNVDAARETVHALKSSSMNVGAKGLSDLCRKIEQNCIQGTIDNSLIQQLYSLYDDVEKALNDVLK